MRVAVVGTCGSGKTTIVQRLRALGYDAYAVGQEHSIIRDLWKHQRPDALVYLEAPLATIRARRGSDWPEWLYQVERDRLADARAHATVVVDTGALSVDEAVAEVIRGLERARRRGPSPADGR